MGDRESFDLEAVGRRLKLDFAPAPDLPEEMEALLAKLRDKKPTTTLR